MSIVPFVFQTDKGWYSVDRESVDDRFVTHPVSITRARVKIVLGSLLRRETCDLTSEAIDRCLQSVVLLEHGCSLADGSACDICDLARFLGYAVAVSQFTGKTARTFDAALGLGHRSTDAREDLLDEAKMKAYADAWTRRYEPRVAEIMGLSGGDGATQTQNKIAGRYVRALAYMAGIGKRSPVEVINKFLGK